MSVITAQLSFVHPVTHQNTNFSDRTRYNFQPESTNRNYLQQAEVEYIQMLEDAVDEVRRLIDEVNRLSTDILQGAPVKV